MMIDEETNIMLAIDTALHTFLERRRHVYANIQVTDLCYCLRRAYFNKTMPNTNNDTDIRLVVGILLHDTILNELAELLHGVTECLTVYVHQLDNGEYLTIYGMCDLLTDNYVLELKTCNYPPNNPLNSHVMQLNAYLTMFEREYGYLVYVSRNNIEKRIFRIDFNEELWNKTVDRAITLYNCLKHNQPPEPEKSGLCNLCPFKPYC